LANQGRQEISKEGGRIVVDDKPKRQVNRSQFETSDQIAQRPPVAPKPAPVVSVPL